MGLSSGEKKMHFNVTQNSSHQFRRKKREKMSEVSGHSRPMSKHKEQKRENRIKSSPSGS